ncbi:MAG: carboxymuconolactone decarboxylase family protein, partial [Candidatus Omnitrophica bacterium]|nr:carboxymuconolactone decarboxylase family protein [Candidatus Omnitrophota bacterium]
TMARHPALFKAMCAMVEAIYGSSSLEPSLKRFIGHITSSAAGCQYCMAHTAHEAHRNGTTQEKIDDLWLYETSGHFSDRERAALRVAQHAGMSPSTVTDAHFDDLKKFFTEDEIVEIVAVISLFGFLNRWNATIATDIESSPLRFATKNNALENKELI